MTEINHIKNFIKKNGILSYSKHYEDDCLQIYYSVETDNYHLSLSENNFSEELRISHKEINDNIFANKIIIEKNSEKINFILETANWRGDFEDKILSKEEENNCINIF